MLAYCKKRIMIFKKNNNNDIIYRDVFIKTAFRLYLEKVANSFSSEIKGLFFC
jgi:hypothetical protein